MKKAFCITVYQLPNQLNCFLEQILKDEDADIFIHVDLKFANIIPQIMVHERVFICKNNIAVNWGSDENIKVHLKLYKEVLKTGKQYEYVFLCSGQDMLIKEGLDAFLEEHKGIPFLGILESPYYEKYNRAQTLYIWPESFRRNYPNRFHPKRVLRGVWRKLAMTGKIPFGKKKINFDVSGMSFGYFNYAWPVLPFDMMQYLVKFVDENPGFMELFNGAFDPEEMFYGIFFMNSPFRDRIKFEKKNFTSRDANEDNIGRWSPTLMFQYKQTATENRPPVLTISDIHTLEESGKYLARKFDERVDADVITYFKNKICDV